MTALPPTNDEIRDHIKNHFRAEHWGLTDCDRCPSRRSTAPCDGCSLWPYLIRDFKHTGAVRGHPMPPLPTESEDIDTMFRKSLLKLALMTKDEIESMETARKEWFVRAMSMHQSDLEQVG